MINLHHLRYFWAVAHEGHLTRAAARLNVSQSAVSVQIARLEAELGQQLFERRGRRLDLTEAGRIALDHADAIFSISRDLASTLRETGQRRQVLRVGSVSTLSRNFQLGFLRPLFQRQDLEIIVRSAATPDLLRALAAHQLDVVLSNNVPPRDATTSWVVHTIAEQPVILVGRPSRTRSRTLKDVLAREPLVLPSSETGIRAGFDALVERLGVRPRVVAEVDDMAMLRLLAREHLGLAVVPRIVVRDEIRARRLVEIAELPGLVEVFYAITLSRRYPNQLLRLLISGPSPI
ncbi:MAG: LysR family transcriptional regulator [Vicinamibacterales bacterium]